MYNILNNREGGVQTMIEEINEEYNDFQQVFEGKREPKAENAFEQFVKAFKDGNVGLALKIYDENLLQTNVMLTYRYRNDDTGKYDGTMALQEPLLHTLIWHIDPTNENQIEILTRIIKNPKNENINLRSTRGADVDYDNNNANTLMAAIDRNIPSIISAILSRDDVDVYAEENTYDAMQVRYNSTAFVKALEKAEKGELEPLYLLIKSGKIDLNHPMTEKITRPYIDLLKENKEKIEKGVAAKLKQYEPDPKKVAELQELEKKAKAAAGVIKPVEPKKPLLFGKKQYDAKMKEYEKQSREYMSARKDIHDFEAAKQEIDAQQQVYDAKREELGRLFRVIDDATKEPLKVSSKPREV